MQGKEVQQHLDVQAHADIGQVKFLFAGLVVHHPDVQLVVLDPAVHPVHLAPYPQLAAGLGDGHGRQRPVLPAEGQLKGHGNKVGVPQLLRHLVDDGVGGGPQPPEKIPEPGVPVLEVVQLPGHILVDILPHQLVQPVVVHGGKAPLGQHVPGHIFQQVMEKGADLWRVEGRRFPGLGPKAVLHEIGEVAGPQPFQPGGGHGDAFPINRLHSRRRQPAPTGVRRPCHGIQAAGAVRRLPEVLPQGTAGFPSGGFHSGANRCQAVCLVSRFPFQPQIREELLQPFHHEGGPQFTAGDIRDRIAYRQSLRGLGQGRIEILQLHAHPLHAAGRQFDAPEGQFLAVVLVQ